MKRPLLAAFALLCAFGLCIAPSLPAQTTTVTASSISLGGTAISAGTITLTPVDNNGIPIPFVTGGGGLNGPTAFSGTIASGAISGTFAVPDACLTTPVNIIYQALITNTATHISFGYKIVGLCGATWALDNYAPPSTIVNVQSIIGYHGTSVPGSCVAPSFFTNDTTHEIMSCVGGVYVHGPTNLYAISAALTTTSSTTDAVTATGMTSSGHCQLTPTNSSASTNVATTYVSTKATNSVTVTHTGTSGMTYDLICTPF